MNCIVVFNKDKDSVLFCKRKREPYSGLLNFVGGKVEKGEPSEEAAYRELFEETGIGRKQICLYRLMDITYYHQRFVLEMYVGKLEEDVNLCEEKNPLLWLPLTEDFADPDRFAGEQNIAHIINVALKYPIPEKSFMSDGQYIGIDGCRNGWIAAVLDYGNLRIERHETILDIMREFPTADAYLIDMAIGLPERFEEAEKRPDKAARKELGKHGSTVFPIPCRQAIMVDPNDPQAVIKLRELNLAVLGKSLSAQSINIIPKIRELDVFLDDHREYKNVLCESHPELCFTRLNGKALMMNKKTADGLEERRSILEKFLEKGMIDGVQVRAKELRCMPDDIMDAVCLAVSAALKAHGMCDTIPEEPETDVRGLVMQMIVPK
jgi:8-oxo-dGTP diphosphatase